MWKKRPTSGLAIEFCRDAIELIFTIKIAIADSIEQITNWGPMWTLTRFCRIFLFNWNDAVSYTVHAKKKTKRCRFERHCGSSSSPGRMKQGKKKIFLPPVFTDFLPLKSIKRTPTKDPHLPEAFHVLKKREEMCLLGGGGAAAQ